MSARSGPPHICALVSFAVLVSGCDFVFRLDRVESSTRDPGEPIARWDFNDAAGTVVTDSIEPGVDLVLAPETSATWTASSLIVTAPITVRSAAPASDLIAACKAAGILTLEAWIAPASDDLVGLGPARVFTISLGPIAESNLMLGQSGQGEWVVRMHTSTTSSFTELRTGRVITAQPGLSHVVLVHDGMRRTLFVDGVAHATDMLGGDLSVWSDDYLVGVANEAAGDERPWLGEVHRIALFAAALDPPTVYERFMAGPD